MGTFLRIPTRFGAYSFIEYFAGLVCLVFGDWRPETLKVSFSVNSLILSNVLNLTSHTSCLCQWVK